MTLFERTLQFRIPVDVPAIYQIETVRDLNNKGIKLAYSKYFWSWSLVIYDKENNLNYLQLQNVK